MGSTCFDPLFYYFPNDEQAYKSMESSFIFGGSILVSPVLQNLPADTKTFSSYFPTTSGSYVSLLDTT